jgi:hypothetical protein
MRKNKLTKTGIAFLQDISCPAKITVTVSSRENPERRH